MARVLVVGSVAYDTIETLEGTQADLLGGSAVYFSLAARIFSTVALSSVVGEDFAPEDRELLKSAGVDIECLDVVKGQETFRWHGKYHENMNSRDTISVDLNVFDEFKPDLPERYRKCPFVFLANGSTVTQLSLLEQVEHHKPVVFFDTMDLWIETEREGVQELLERTTGIILNDSEALLLSDENNIVRAGQKLREMGGKNIIIKKGEHGVLAFLEKGAPVALPAYPMHEVVDPTGAGDSFAGAFMGWLARSSDLEAGDYRSALSVATTVASFCVESFGTDRLAGLDLASVERRLADYRDIIRST